jgi:uncharacterized low-complexity protein
MIAILPVSLLAQDTAAAMLRSDGIGVLVNKNPAPPSTALFSDDLIETQKTAVARIEASGSTADIHPETMIQFEGNELVLEHGSLSVNTSRGLRVRVGCVTVTPVNDAEWTRYDVTDLDGKVTVSALKMDVYIDARSSNPQQARQSAHSSRVTVHEGEQKSREEKCGAADIKTPGAIAGKGAIMNSPWTIGAGIAGVGVLSCLGLCHNDDPISPTKP